MNDSSSVRMAIVALAALISGAAQAQLVGGVEGSDEPIYVYGDSVEAVGKLVTLEGAARAVQGPAILSASRIVATLNDEQQPVAIEAQGEVRYTNGKEAVAGDTALYDDLARTITFTGDVVVTQGDSVITGGRLVYWIDTGRISLAPAAGQRVRGVFKSKPAADA